MHSDCKHNHKCRGREADADSMFKSQLRLGTLTGFQYFSCYLRGREELLVTINREAPAVDAGHLGSPTHGALQVAPSPRKPISPDPMGKPPASPASREITAAGDTECVFLIGAYQRSCVDVDHFAVSCHRPQC